MEFNCTAARASYADIARQVVGFAYAGDRAGARKAFATPSS
jgi:hypothetical protein